MKKIPGRTRKKYAEWQKEIIRQEYTSTDTVLISERTGMTPHEIRSYAYQQKMKKASGYRSMKCAAQNKHSGQTGAKSKDRGDGRISHPAPGVMVHRLT